MDPNFNNLLIGQGQGMDMERSIYMLSLKLSLNV
jgi:hypothetical protein